MTLDVAAATLPWNVPTPVREGGFIPLHAEHARFDVVVDLGKIGTFDNGSELYPPSSLLWSDLQSLPGISWDRRMGAGRAGVYRGKYLKGVGRTTLAANWHSIDRYHNSGHLLPSGAAREYLISIFLKACGADAAIVPCEGILAKELDPSLQGYYRLTFGELAAASPVDEALQAISIKPFQHIRFTNLHWWMAHATFDGTSTDFNQILERLTQHLAAAIGVPWSEELQDPAGFPKFMRQVYDKARSRFAVFHQLGLFWGSYANNFTIDGRFLDLEVGTLLGKLPYALLSPGTKPRAIYPDDGYLYGLELMVYAWNARIFNNAWRYFLASSLEQPGLVPQSMRVSVSEMLHQWHSATTDPEYWLNTDHGVVDSVMAIVNADSSLGRVEAQKVEAVALRYYNELFHSSEDGSATLDFHRAEPQVLIASEPCLRQTVYHAVGAGRGVSERENAELLEALHVELSQHRTVDGFLESLRSAQNMIERQVAMKHRHSASEAVLQRCSAPTIDGPSRTI